MAKRCSSVEESAREKLLASHGDGRSARDVVSAAEKITDLRAKRFCTHLDDEFHEDLGSDFTLARKIRKGITNITTYVLGEAIDAVIKLV